MAFPPLRTNLWLGTAAVVALLSPLASCGARTGLLITSAPDEDAASEDSGRRHDAGDAADAEDATVACTTGVFDLTRESPAVVFVLDDSGSMATPFGGSGQSRWGVLTSALAATLPPVDDTIELGALIFPSAGSGRVMCVAPTALDLSPAKGNVGALVAEMERSAPHGGTPTDVALTTAATALEGFRAGSNARALVLATDGAPNCNASLNPMSCTCVTGGSCRRNADDCLDDTRTVSTIGAFAAAGIPTYVIGIADASDAQFVSVLDAMAVAGGRPLTGAGHAYYSGSSPEDLEDALVEIRNQVGACAFLTASVPSANGTITVTSGGVTIPFDPTRTQGWNWGDEALGEIVLYGTACNASLADGGASDLSANVTCGMAVDAGADAAGEDATADGDATP